jgi:catechol 2,3-dioxygenase-like lactoylglutathione lyase family enzyme
VTAKAHWKFLVPNLPVRDVPAAQEWYREVFGLGINWLWEDNFGSVGEHRVELFLYESDDPQPGICSIFVDDVDAVYERCREHEAEIVSELVLKPWNVREFTVRDPDGNRFRIGKSVEESVPHPEFSYPGM